MTVEASRLAQILRLNLMAKGSRDTHQWRPSEGDGRSREAPEGQILPEFGEYRWLLYRPSACDAQRAQTLDIALDRAGLRAISELTFACQNGLASSIGHHGRAPKGAHGNVVPALVFQIARRWARLTGPSKSATTKPDRGNPALGITGAGVGGDRGVFIALPISGKWEGTGVAAGNDAARAIS